MDSFFEQVYSIVAEIPYGKVVSYSQIAWMLNRPRGARQVGWAMRHCPDHLPWHRVVKVDGSFAGPIFSEEQKKRLQAEGVIFLLDGRVDMGACSWNGSEESLSGV